MAEAIRMPLLSDTMKEGVIAEWHKKVGDEVKSDDVIADVETDKATMEVTPYVDGTLLYIAVDKGQGVPINGIMAIIGKPGEDFQAILDNEKNAAPAAAASTAPAPQATAAPAEPVAAAPAAPVAAAPAAHTPNPGDANATVVRMPLLSDTMKEGKIVAWHKQVGDIVKSDDAIADVETDKATMEVMPYADGVLLYVGVKEGDAAKINEIIAIVGKAGTDITPYLDSATPAAAASIANSAPAAPVAANTPAAPVAQPAMVSSSNHDNNGGRIIASPLAKKLASDKGIDIHQLVGSGDNGRIIKRDIDTFKAPAAQVAAPKPAVTGATAGTQTAAAPKAAAAPFVPSVQGTESYTDTPVSQMRRIIAQRLAESKFSAPHFYLRMSITMDKAIEARKAINDVAPVKVSFNDLIIKACAMALRKHPAVNSSWMGDFIRQNHHINIGTAVAVDEGLIVPVIKFADQKTLSQISEEANSLIDKARNKKIQPQEFTGNTFTISNLGMMDMDEFTAIINPPDACILAVGKIAPTPVVENNQVVIRQILKLTLSCDHRVVDGAVGVKFMQTLKSHLENPVTMLV